MSNGLYVNRIQKSYKKRPVLRDVSLEVHRGEIVALLGPNGAGKTTCFYTIAGLVLADKGEVTIDGQNVSRMPMFRRVKFGLGYLPQEPSIFRGLTVEQNINAILEIQYKDKITREERLEELLSDFSIEHLRRALSPALSGGERRRLEIARALASDPKYILLDEPFAGVDPIAIDDIRKLVRQLVEKDIGVVITDHNVRDTLEIVDRAYILFDGKMLMSGTPDEVVNNPDVKRVYLGHTFDN